MSPARRNGQALHDLDDVVIACRYKRHAWTLPAFYHEGGTVVAMMVCRDCTAQREQTLDSRGAIMSTRIVYPPGYLLKGQGRAAPIDVRREIMQRVTIYKSRTSAEQRRRR